MPYLDVNVQHQLGSHSLRENHFIVEYDPRRVVRQKFGYFWENMRKTLCIYNGVIQYKY